MTSSRDELMRKQVGSLATEVCANMAQQARTEKFRNLDVHTKGMAFQLVLTAVISKEEGRIFVIDKAVFDEFKRITPKRDWLNLEEHRAPFDRLMFAIYDHQQNVCDSLIVYNEFSEDDGMINSQSVVWKKKPFSFDKTGYDNLSKEEGLPETLYALQCYEALVDSKSFEIVEKLALPTKLAKKRLKKNKAAYVGGFTVLEPKRYSESESTGNGSSKRMHMRRGHWRNLKNKTVWVNSCVVGNGELASRSGYVLN